VPAGELRPTSRAAYAANARFLSVFPFIFNVPFFT
jgi:hypothetical protein